MKRITLNRRAALKGVAGASILAPFSGLLSPSPTEAQTRESAKRILVLELPNIVWQSDWLPTGGRQVNNNTGLATDFVFGPQTSVFEPIRKHVTVVGGLPIEGTAGAGHPGAQIQFMTGGVIGTSSLVNKASSPDPPPLQFELSRHPSMDQLLARDSALLSAGEATRSVTWCGYARADGTHRDVCSFDTSAEPRPLFPVDNPMQAYTSLFAGFVPGTVGADQRARLEQAIRKQRSVLDYLANSMGQLSSRVSGADKARLDAHLTGLRELEARFNVETVDSSAFARVALPPRGEFEGLQPNHPSTHLEILSQFFKLAKLGFGFDRTRVGTLMVSSGNSPMNFSSVIPGFPSAEIHALTHRNYQGKNLDLRMVSNRYCGAIVDFVQDMAETLDADGSTMLDNTMIVLFGEVSISGNGIAAQHDVSNTPLMVMGGKNLGHVGGRYLRYQGFNTHDFWTTMGRRLGLGDEFVMGDVDRNTGVLPELLS